MKLTSLLLVLFLSQAAFAEHAEEGEEGFSQSELREMERKTKEECDALGGRVYPENPTRCYCPEIGDREGTSASAEVWGAKTCGELKEMVFEKCAAEGGRMDTRVGSCLCPEAKSEEEGLYYLSPLPGPATAHGVCKKEKAPPPEPKKDPAPPPKPDAKTETKAHEVKPEAKTPPPLKVVKKEPATKPAPTSRKAERTSVIPTATPSRVGGAIGAGIGALGVAGYGAMVGAPAGPLGIITGAAVGGLIGMIGGYWWDSEPSSPGSSGSSGGSNSGSGKDFFGITGFGK